MKKQINVCDECLLRHSMACPSSAICESKQDKPFFTNEVGKAVQTAYCMGLVNAMELIKFNDPYETVNKIVKETNDVYPNFFEKRREKNG